MFSNPSAVIFIDIAKILEHGDEGVIEWDEEAVKRSNNLMQEIARYVHILAKNLPKVRSLDETR